MQFNETIMYREILEQPSILASMRNRLKDDLAKIRREFDAREIVGIVTAARGSSNHACTYFKYLCEAFVGLACASAAPSVLTLYNGKMCMKNHLVIGVSQSGKAADAIAVLEKANQDGCMTIALTNDSNSPMAKTAQHHLFLGTGEEKSVAATKTFTAQMYTFLLLTEALSDDQKLTDAVAEIANGIQEVLANQAEIVALADKLTGMTESFILGRGIQYAAVLESGLKMQETTYVRSRAYAASDFHHGPFAMIDQNATVFLLMPQGESYRDMEEMATKCEQSGGKTIVYTDTHRKGTLATLKIPSGSDVATPFYSVVTTQLLVNALSVAKGLTPDAPRGLNKVTITK